MSIVNSYKACHVSIKVECMIKNVGLTRSTFYYAWHRLDNDYVEVDEWINGVRKVKRPHPLPGGGVTSM